MKYDLDLGKFRRARVWLGELPDADFLCDKIVARNFDVLGDRAETYLQDHEVIVAVEVLIPTGPSSMYALLGARFTLVYGSAITADVCTSSFDEKVFAGALTCPWEIAYVGLPDEFSAGVLEGVAHSISKFPSFPPGVLRFDCSAHSLVGSSHMIFRRASEILLGLINLHSGTPSEQGVLGCFPETFM